MGVGFLATLAIIVLAVMLLDARSRLKRLEAQVIELRREANVWPAQPAPVAAPPRAEPEPEPQPEPEAPLVLPEEITKAPPVEALAWEQTAPAAVFAPLPEPEAEPEEAPPEPRRGFSVNFEDLFGRRLPIWAGGITLAIAGVFIVRYAIEAGFFERVFTPGVQSVCGMVFGLGLIGGAEWARARREKVADPRVSQALSGAGISTLYAALLVAAQVYHLISPLTAFIGVALVTAGAMGLSLRHGAPSALLGLAGGLAAPAVTQGIAENVPLLSVYLALTIGGLVGVSRLQRWPWLAAAALVGGAGWSLWLMVAGHALDVLGSLSLGGFILLLAIAMPLFAFRDAGQTMLRLLAAAVGALQLALLVAIGGFEPLHWGLFALIAMAGQWLAWRDRAFAMIPTIGAALSFLLLMIWPDPAPGWPLPVAVGLAIIHAVPLLARLWREPARVQSAIEMAAIAMAAPLVALRHAPGGWHAARDVGALGALGGVALALAAAVLGWRVAGRREDARFAVLVGTGGLLAVIAAALGMASWLLPLVTAAAALALLELGRRADDRRIEPQAAAFGLGAVLILLGTVGYPHDETRALIQGRLAQDLLHPLLRWTGLAVAAAWFGWCAKLRPVGDGGGALAVVLAYGALAQVLPEAPLSLVPALAFIALAWWSGRIERRRLLAPLAASALLAAGWIAGPFARWYAEAMLSLIGMAMDLSDDLLGPAAALRRLMLPSLLGLGGLWLMRSRLPQKFALPMVALAALPGLVALHLFYRHGFAGLFGSDFVHTGLAQRLVWCALLAGAGWWLARRGAEPATRAAPVLVAAAALHLGWYSLVLHNPLWADQAVGPVPLANLLAPLFAGLPLCLWLLERIAPGWQPRLAPLRQPVIMAMIALYGWAALRQAFHGTVLTQPGLGGAEDILRSILGIALALGFLLWGIRSRQRNWRIASLMLMLAAVGKVFLFDASGLEGLLRIASFVALGFSLIGIGWLYSRQLKNEATS